MEETGTINEKIMFTEGETGFSILDSKRPRMDPVTPSDSGNNRSELPHSQSVLWKSEGRALTQTSFPKSEHRTHTAEDPQPQSYQDGSSVATVTAPPHPDERALGGGRCPAEGGEQLPAAGAAGEPGSQPGGDLGLVSADSHSRTDRSADSSTRHDCEGKSLERQPAGGDNLPSVYNEEMRQRPSGASPIRKSPLRASESGREVKCQMPDCAHEDALVFHASSQIAEEERANQKRDGRALSGDFLFGHEEEACSHTALLDYSDPKSFFPYIEEGSLPQDEGKYSTFYENGLTEHAAVVHDSFYCDPESGECAGGTAVTCQGVIAVAHEGMEAPVSLESDDQLGAGEDPHGIMGEAAVGTPETQTTVSGGPAAGDDGVGPAGGIEPVLRGQAGEDGGDAGLSPATTPRTASTASPDYSTNGVSSAEQADDGGGIPMETQRHEGNQGDAGRSSTGQYFISAGEPHDNTLLCPPSSPHRPTEAPPAGGDRIESHCLKGHLREEQVNPANCSPAAPVHLASYSPTENAPADRMTQRLQGRGECLGGDVKTVLSVMSGKPEDAPEGQDGRHKAEAGNVSARQSADDSSPCPAGVSDDESAFPIGEEQGNGVMVETSEGPLSSFPSPPLRDAVVPGPRYLNPRLYAQNADSPLAQHSCNRSSPVPSASVLSDRVPGGFDTFEKIQLSPDDDEGGLEHSLLLASPPRQLCPPAQHFMPEAESGIREEREPEVGTNECQREIIETAYSDLALTSSHNPEPQSGGQPGLSWSVPMHLEFNISDRLKCSARPTERDAQSTEDAFQMKEEFDLVIEELSMFFEISKNDLPLDDAKADLGEKPSGSGSGEWSRRPTVEDHNETSSGGKADGDDGDGGEEKLEEGDNGCRLQTCGANPQLSCANGGSDHEQEVPLDCSHPCQELDDSMYPSRKHAGAKPRDEKTPSWTPSFMLQPLADHLTSHILPDAPRRLQPLTTCARPIRVGLSKRVKTTHLHRPHPYQ